MGVLTSWLTPAVVEMPRLKIRKWLHVWKVKKIDHEMLLGENQKVITTKQETRTRS
jgi:hypothetical protein